MLWNVAMKIKKINNNNFIPKENKLRGWSLISPLEWPKWKHEAMCTKDMVILRPERFESVKKPHTPNCQFKIKQNTSKLQSQERQQKWMHCATVKKPEVLEVIRCESEWNSHDLYISYLVKLVRINYWSRVQIKESLELFNVKYLLRQCIRENVKISW